MKKYTANYTDTNANFVIQNLVTKQVNNDLSPLLLEVKNDLLCGFPTPLSKYLQSQLDEIDNFEKELKTILLPTAIIRFQVLLIELLTHQYLTFDEDWCFNVLVSDPKESEIVHNVTYRNEAYGLVQEVGPSALELAINDVQIRIGNLWQLKNKNELKKPKYSITSSYDTTQCSPSTEAITIDFSLFKRYTDENEFSEDVIFVRADHFDLVTGKTIA